MKEVCNMLSNEKLLTYAGHEVKVINVSGNACLIDAATSDIILSIPSKASVDTDTCLYLYEDLSDEAKKKAREGYVNRYSWDDIDSDMLKEVFQQGLDDLKWYDTDVEFSLSCCQGDGVSFTGHIDGVDAFELIKNRVCSKFMREVYTLCRRNLVDIECVRTSHQYSHAHTVYVNVTYKEDNYDIKPERSDAIEYLELVLNEWKNVQCHEFEKQGYDEIDYHSSDEYVEEELINNDYYFHEDGTEE